MRASLSVHRSVYSIWFNSCIYHRMDVQMNPCQQLASETSDLNIFKFTYFFQSSDCLKIEDWRFQVDFSLNLQTWGVQRWVPGLDRPMQPPWFEDLEESLTGFFNLQSLNCQNFKRYENIHLFKFEYAFWHMHCIVVQTSCTSILGSLLTLQRLWSKVEFRAESKCLQMGPSICNCSLLNR